MISGTMACLWCIKTQIVKMTATAFNRWKYSNLSAASVVRPSPKLKRTYSPKTSSTSTIHVIQGEARRYASPARDPSPHKEDMSMGNCHHDFKNSLRSPKVLQNRSRSTSPPKTKTNMSSSPQAYQNQKYIGKSPSYAQSTYSSLKMFTNEHSRREREREKEKHIDMHADVQYKTYLQQNKSRRSPSYDNQMSRGRGRSASSDRDRIMKSNNSPMKYSKVAFEHENDDVSEISIDANDFEVSKNNSAWHHPKSRNAGKKNTNTNTNTPLWNNNTSKLSPSSASGSASAFMGRSKQFNKSVLSDNALGNSQRPLHQRNQQQKNRKTELELRLRKRPGHQNMDGAQLRLLYGHLDERLPPNKWSKSLRS